MGSSSLPRRHIASYQLCDPLVRVIRAPTGAPSGGLSDSTIFLIADYASARKTLPWERAMFRGAAADRRRARGRGVRARRHSPLRLLDPRSHPDCFAMARNLSRADPDRRLRRGAKAENGGRTDHRGTRCHLLAQLMHDSPNPRVRQTFYQAHCATPSRLDAGIGAPVHDVGAPVGPEVRDVALRLGRLRLLRGRLRLLLRRVALLELVLRLRVRAFDPAGLLRRLRRVLGLEPVLRTECGCRRRCAGDRSGVRRVRDRLSGA